MWLMGQSEALKALVTLRANLWDGLFILRINPNACAVPEVVQAAGETSLAADLDCEFIFI
ncbi:MAG: hypothetical protein RLY20_1756 [Verrucomicrobiota bacterium]